MMVLILMVYSLMVLFGIGKSLDSNCVHPKQLYANLNNFSDLKIVNESKPKVLYDVIPIIRLVPTPMNEINRDNTYACPVYKTSERKGTLSTTGHSTNFVLWIDFPSNREQRHWINRGVAALCALDD